MTSSVFFSVRHFDAARLAASGLTSLAAAVSGVNGVTTAAAMGMGGLSFNPYSHLPPPLLPYSHLTAVSTNYPHLIYMLNGARYVPSLRFLAIYTNLISLNG